ncbi:MAG: stage V sporulation protein AD [Oscillospiraceae bacterium]|nr:stage V sporulation protein AD [Oscillospiraceae bacterium]
MTGASVGERTLDFGSGVIVAAGAAAGGKQEGAGPLGEFFDHLCDDSYFGQTSWEGAETVLQQRCLHAACVKAGVEQAALRWVLSGDLQNQCTSSAYAMRDVPVPHLGLYSACATMGEALCLGAVLTAMSGGPVCAMTSSHFCVAERQFRTPLEYGCQRPPTSQWTVTGAGAVILRASGTGPALRFATFGRVVDAGIKDLSNMGAAMAPAALDTLQAHFHDTGRSPADYDAVITGDLGRCGNEILADLLRREGVEALSPVFTDCGMLIFDPEAQDVHAGGSGAGCSASVLAGHILRNMNEGVWNRVLFAPTGALMSPVTVQQGESIPAVCHAVALENVPAPAERQEKETVSWN